MNLTFLHKASGGLTIIQLRGTDVLIGTVVGGVPKYAPIEGANLNAATIVKEHPDLKGKSINKIKREGVRRFKKHLFSLETDQQKIEYLKKDLEQYGYKLLTYQLPGGEPVKVNQD